MVEPEPPAAPPEAAPQIVTEAEQPSGAVETALRPAVRPSRPASARPAEASAAEPRTAPQETEDSAPRSSPASDGVEDALAAALAGTAEPASAREPSASAAAADPGPPLTGAERDAFRIAVQSCWVVDPGSQAGRTTVTVVFELGRDARVQGDVRLLSHNAESQAAADSAFAAARRAILRCQGEGFPLPPEKYEQWRLVEMTFNPTLMTIQ
ncbi:hypothetical protein ruthe_01577 [Rubellimicrobium thermophilum DSM 16684]|uniref:Cell division and transport-associated protein TolA n=1 Tax=Rubellimicrobium thermophilum DSM 16684 TaxID=1123069 RepID=S9QWS5_9RHOB|nr:hypothetical protein [Rubellimicrobium thermophilum]EPX85856.1 hypothetical protein ruthe_01577 [Rubellimicrobium thermophilum DSM 16684]